MGDTIDILGDMENEFVVLHGCSVLIVKLSS